MNKPKVPMVPKYYFVVNTGPQYSDSYLGYICSWHHTLAVATKELNHFKRNGIPTVIYGTDFIIRDSNYLAPCYGGAAPEWRTPVLLSI